jgi:hypothetical protein
MLMTLLNGYAYLLRFLRNLYVFCVRLFGIQAVDRNLNRCNLPVSVRGNCVRNSMVLGYL